MFLFSKVSGENFSPNVFIKKYDRATFQLSFAINSPHDALGPGRYSEPHCPVLWWQQCTAETKSGLSLLLLLTPFPVSMWEGEKCLLLLLAGSSNEGGLALESRSPSSKAFKHTVNLSPFRKVQLQLHLAKWDPAAQASQGALVSALWAGMGSWEGPQKATAKRSREGSSSGVGAAGARRAESGHDSEKLSPISVPLLTLVSPFPSHFTVPLELAAISSTTSFWDLHKQRAHC